MKKLLTLILLVCLLATSSTIVFAEGTLDLSGYSDSELITLCSL